MIRIATAFAIFIFSFSYVSAREIGDQYETFSVVKASVQHHYQKTAQHHHSRAVAKSEPRSSGGIVTIETAAHIEIKVAAIVANKFADLIADLVEHGYMPKEIGCIAHGGHIRHSFHYRGLACDIDQEARNVTTKFMKSKEARELIKEHGLDDGCDFGDCGHVSYGEIGHSSNHRHYAYFKRHHYAGR